MGWREGASFFAGGAVVALLLLVLVALAGEGGHVTRGGSLGIWPYVHGPHGSLVLPLGLGQ